MNEENVRKLEPFYKEIWKNSKRFTNTNEDVPSYIDVDIVFDIVDKYDAINGKKLEKSEKARLKCLNKIKTLGKFDGENFTRSFTLWSADFNELAKMLDLDKGEIEDE